MGNDQPEHTPECRIIDPTRTALSMNDHAARALNRFIGAKPEDIETAPFKEGSAMRELVKAKLEAVMRQKAAEQADGKTDTAQATSPVAASAAAPTLVEAPAAALPVEATPTRKTKGPLILLSKSPHTHEHKKYLETTIQTALPSVRGAFKNARIAIPSDDEILQAMIMTARFTPEQIEALMRNIQVPGLIVLPPKMKSFLAYAGFLNANKKGRGHGDVYISDSRKTAFAKQDKALEDERRVNPAEYKFGIGEMAQEPANRTGKLKDIVKEWKVSDLAKLTRTATPREYAVLQAQASDLMDLKGWTILAEGHDPHKIIGGDYLVSNAAGNYGWGGERGVGFSDGDPERVYDRARVRPVVVG